jgi:uncharacterized protein
VSATAPPPPDTRPAPGRRVGEIDVLRGFALLGILLMNALVMAGPHGGYDGPVNGTADRWAAWAALALFGSKFYILFSFLLGYSFTFQERSAERAGASTAARHLRRSAVLLLLGAAHAVLLYPGDILTTYAVLGLVLLACRRAAPRTLVKTAAWLLAAICALFIAVGVLFVLFDEGPGQDGLRELTAAYRGDAADVIGANAGQVPDALISSLLLSPDVLAAVIAGYAAGRVRLLETLTPARMRRTALIALPVGLAGALFFAMALNGPLPDSWFFLGLGVGTLTAPALTAVYVCALLTLLRSPRGAAVTRALAPAGRMSLTLYLTQSLALALVFTGYGLALYDRVGSLAVLLGCLVLYAAQLAAAARLMRRFRYGPVELLLRAATRWDAPSKEYGAGADRPAPAGEAGRLGPGAPGSAENTPPKAAAADREDGAGTPVP